MRSSISWPKLAIPLLCIASQLTFAESWTGILVDAKCFRSAQNNHNVSESPGVQDMSLEIRLCAPKAKTRLFAVLPRNGDAVVLDAANNAKAAEIVHQAGSKQPLFVTVNGDAENSKVLALDLKTPAR